MDDSAVAVSRCKCLPVVGFFRFDRPINPSHTWANTPYWGLLGVRPLRASCCCHVDCYAALLRCTLPRFVHQLRSRFSIRVGACHSTRRSAVAYLSCQVKRSQSKVRGWFPWLPKCSFGQRRRRAQVSLACARVSRQQTRHPVCSTTSGRAL